MSGDESQSGQQPSRRLKLVLKTSPPPGETHADEKTAVPPKDGSSSPPRPSYSPVTPTLSHEPRLETRIEKDKPELKVIDEPPPLPLSIDDNADAIALRATISLLQMQRQQSLKDIRDLDKIKDAALSDPRAFADDLRAGKLSKSTSDVLAFDDVEYEDDENASTEEKEVASKFGRLPNAQHIARCPPIEWSKYHIVGKPLDDMHELQKQCPGVSESDFSGTPRNRHEILAPYRPFKDKLNSKK